MNSTTYITLDMQAPETGVIAYAKQNDKLSRRLSATLKDGATSWTPPTGAAAAIRYSKPDGTGGFYDVLEDSSPAIVVSGNVALMTLAEQCVTVPGQVRMELNFYTAAGAKLTSFTWLLNVEASVLTDATIVSSSYYNVLTAQVAQTLQYKNDAASSAQAAAASAALAQQISQQGKGWFATDTALKAAFPTGQNGWWAIVGAGDNIWTWDADTNAWVNTHTQTDLSNYYTKSQADAAFLGKSETAEDTNKFGGQLPAYYAPINNMQPGGYKTDGLSYTGCTYAGGGYVKTGKLVTVNIRLQATSSGSGLTFVEGLPVPAGGSSAPAYVAGVARIFNTFSSAYITVAGGAVVDGAISSSNSVIISFTYLTD